MKQFASLYLMIYFLLAGMMTSGDLHELLKISNLVEHINEHSEEQPKVTLIDLIKMHYGFGHPDEKQDKHHDNLPFQSHNCNHTSAVYVVNLSGTIDFELFENSTSVLSFYKAQFPHPISGSIWQPPQLQV